MTTTRALGTTGIQVPRALLGCGTFGGVGSAKHLVGRGLDRMAAFTTLDEALALGIDVLDTAERYARGESERTIGEWLRRRPPEITAGVRIATKVAPPMVDGVEGTPFDRAYIGGKLKTSLERLGLERVTFYLSHAPDKTTPIMAAMVACWQVRDADSGQRIGRIAAAAKRRGTCHASFPDCYVDPGYRVSSAAARCASKAWGLSSRWGTSSSRLRRTLTER